MIFVPGLDFGDLEEQREKLRQEYYGSSAVEDKTYTGAGGDFGGKGASRSFPDINSILETFLTGLASSALDAEIAAADRVNSFNAEQSEINRLFQQSSAEKAMEFSANQAEINRNFQQSSAEKAMEFSAGQVQKQMDFQERMSNTAYQRAVQDLKAAGLSPLLAYSNFSTSSPSGSSGVGYSSSGAMASGVSSSGSSAAGVKANPSSGKIADISPILSAVTSIVSTGLSSVSSIVSNFVGKKGGSTNKTGSSNNTGSSYDLIPFL